MNFVNKKYLIRLTILTSLVIFILFSGTMIFAAENVLTLKLGTVVTPDHAYNLGANKFAELIEERTGGKVKIIVYPGGQLGSGERELIEGEQMGVVDIAVTATGPLSGFSSLMMVVDLPYLFRDNDHVDKVLDGSIGRNILDELEKSGIKGLAFWENGFRNFTNSVRPIYKPEDLKGLKLRTMENPVHMDIVRSLGALATPMAWGEVYTSMQMGVIDGQENPVAIIWTQKVYEVQKYLCLDGHVYSPSPLTMSLAKFNSLSPEFQKIFLDTALEVTQYERSLIRNSEAEQVELIKKAGLEVTYPDKAPFLEATKQVYDKYLEKYPEWKSIVEEILAVK